MAPPAFAADHIYFRDLGGASTEADVRKVFPKVKPDKLCDGKIGRSAGVEYLCRTLGIEYFNLNGETYSLTFVFNPARRLAMVMIDRQVGYDLLPARDRLSKAQLDGAYMDLYTLLASKYGRELKAPSPCKNSETPRLYRRCAVWQAGSQATWNLGADSVRLQLKVRPGTTEPIRYFGDISISYRFAPIGEAR